MKTNINNLVIAQGLLPRVITGTMDSVVQEYKDYIQDGMQFPPILVWEKAPNTFWIIDGVHRYTAYRELGYSEIEIATVPCKDETEFRLKAIECNLKHGKALTPQERRILAKTLHLAGVSKETIMHLFGISQTTFFRWVEEKELIEKDIEEKKQDQEKHLQKILEITGFLGEERNEEDSIDTLENLTNIPDDYWGYITKDLTKDPLTKALIDLGVPAPSFPIPDIEAIEKNKGLSTAILAQQHLKQNIVNYLLSLPNGEYLKKKYFLSLLGEDDLVINKLTVDKDLIKQTREEVKEKQTFDSTPYAKHSEDKESKKKYEEYKKSLFNLVNTVYEELGYDYLASLMEELAKHIQTITEKEQVGNMV
ncbi:MAG TPA: hypothetical protein ENO30_05595 [Thermodesulfobium narugense]|nr:hypothetical protein [Thermodesulfobium narugense]